MEATSVTMDALTQQLAETKLDRMVMENRLNTQVVAMTIKERQMDQMELTIQELKDDLDKARAAQQESYINFENDKVKAAIIQLTMVSIGYMLTASQDYQRWYQLKGLIKELYDVSIDGYMKKPQPSNRIVSSVVMKGLFNWVAKVLTKKHFGIDMKVSSSKMPVSLFYWMVKGFEISMSRNGDMDLLRQFGISSLVSQIESSNGINGNKLDFDYYVTLKARFEGQ